MQMHPLSFFSAPSSAPKNLPSARPTRANRILAFGLSTLLCLGLMPVVPAWADDATSPSSASEANATPHDTATEGPAATPDTTAQPVEAPASSDNEATAPASTSTSGDTPATPTDAADSANGTSGTTDPTADTGTDPASPITDPNVTDPNADEGVPPTNPDTTPGVTVDQYFPTDKKAASKLLKNLTKRFVKDGDNSKLNDLMVNAAIALNTLGKGEKIDTDAIAKKMASAEKKAKDGLTLGQYGRYIMMLTAGGIDCTAATIDGKTRNLVLEMEELTLDTDPTIEDAVYLLPVYGYDEYRHTKGLTEEGLIDLILTAQDDDGFFWAGEDAETYSIPLTSQALLALIPYLDDDNVAAAVSAATEALYDAQLIDGSWPADGLKLDGDVPATAYATTALVAMGANPAKDLITSDKSTPLGYLTAHADKKLDGYADLGKKTDAVTSAAVLMALAANQGVTETKKAYDVYDLLKVERAAEHRTTATAAKTTPTSHSTYRATSGTKTIPQSGDELPLAITLLSLAALGSGIALLRMRRTTSR